MKETFEGQKTISEGARQCGGMEDDLKEQKDSEGCTE